MEITYYTLKELIPDEQWEIWMDNLGRDDMFYKYISKEIDSHAPFWFIYGKEEDCDEGLDRLHQAGLIKDIYQWLKANQPLFNRTYDLIYNPTPGTAKRVDKFNDTPQQQGDYSTDKFTSTVSTSEQSGTVSSDIQLRHLQDIITYVIYDFEKRFVIYVA